MAGALFARVKTWIAETLTASDLNAEIQNILDKFGPQWMDDYSANVAQYQSTVDPGSSGSESLPTTLAGELERLRYVILRILGANATYWYDAPSTDLSLQVQSAFNVGMQLTMEPEIYPNNTTGCVGNLINRGVIGNPYLRSQAGIRAADFTSTSGEVLFGTYAWTTGTRGDSSIRCMAYPGKFSANDIGTLLTHFRNFNAGDYIAWNPVTGHELYLDGAGLLTAKITEKNAASESAKNTVTVAGGVSRAGNADYQTVAMKWRCNDYSGASTDLLELELDDAEEGTQLTAQDIDINVDGGGNWLIGCKPNNPSWDHVLAMNGLPTAHSTAWSADGTAGNGSVSNGVLTIASSSGNYLGYQQTSFVDLTSGMTIEFKMRITQMNTGAHNIGVAIREDTSNLGFAMIMHGDSVTFKRISSTFNFSDDRGRHFRTPNQYDWHVYRITYASDGTGSLYIDGVHIGDLIADTTLHSGTDLIHFGEFSNSSSDQSTEWEFFKIYDGGEEAPIAANGASNAQLDEVSLVSNIVDATTLTRAQTQTASAAFNSLGPREFQVPYGQSLPNNTAGSNVAISTTAAIRGDIYYMGDGRTKLDWSFNSSFLTGNTGEGFYKLVHIQDYENSSNRDIDQTVGFPSAIFYDSSTDPRTVSLDASAVGPIGLNLMAVVNKVTTGTMNIANSLEGLTDHMFDVGKG